MGRKTEDCGHVKKCRWTIEQVRCYAKSQGYKVLDDKYIKSNDKLVFICPKGHLFKMVWANFYSTGRRCSECAGNKKLTISDARKTFYTAGLELLEKTYVNNSTPMKARCFAEEHVVYPRLDSIKAGAGCKMCSRNAPLSKKIINERLKDADRNVCLFGEYMGSQTKSSFKCVSCGNVWAGNPSSILYGTGCPMCSGNMKLSKIIVNQRLGADNRKIRLIGEYTGGKAKSLFVCDICNIEWLAVPDNVSRGTGCPACSSKARLSTSIVNDRLIKMGGDIRMTGKYVTIGTPAKFICALCGNEWTSTPNDILNKGHGCPSCARYGFKPNNPAIMYYLKVEHRNRIYYKIGITNRTVGKRFEAKDLKKITVLKEWKYKKGSTALKKEQGILKKYAKHRYRGRVKILKSSGNTELFTKDVLDLDTN